jgi:hypothetical protein
MSKELKSAGRDALQKFDDTKKIWSQLRADQKGEIASLSERINDAQKRLRAIMDKPVMKLCPNCKSSCCAYNAFCYLNMTDNIQYFALGRHPQLELAIIRSGYCGEDLHKDTSQTRCVLLQEGRGCILPGDLRPWVCTAFICEDLRSEMGNDQAAIANDLFRSIRVCRRRIQQVMKNRPQNARSVKERS